METKKYIFPLNMNGLKGRLLNMPAEKSKFSDKNIVLIYGQHTSIERMMPLAQILSRYGNVVMPDLPGFGGMQSFYKIGLIPSYENFADYLASFIRLKFKRKKLTIVAMSTGFPIITIMLQKYPEIAKKVNFVVSIAGFVHHEDFKLPQKYRFSLKIGTKFMSFRPVSFFFRTIFLNHFFIWLSYRIMAKKHHKFKDANPEEFKKRVYLEVKLWKSNDPRTHAYAIYQLVSLDLCDRKIDVPLLHLNSKVDIYLNHEIINQHLQIIYQTFRSETFSSVSHAPATTASVKEIDQLLPKVFDDVMSGKESI